jgi:hypothetical protein
MLYVPPTPLHTPSTLTRLPSGDSSWAQRA